MYMIEKVKEVDKLAVDEACRTPRQLALINSPFFKMLIGMERE